MTAKCPSMGRYQPNDPEVDQQLVDWFSDQRSQGKNYSVKMTFIIALFTLPLQVVYVFGLSMLITDRIVFIFAGLAVNSIMIWLKRKELGSYSAFKASPGWYTKWKHRHAISMRNKTTLAQRLPANMEDKVVEFHRFVLRARQCCGLLIQPNPEHGRNSDKQSFTVILAVKADGGKLPLKVIFKGVCQLRIKVPRRMQVSVHKKAWMDEEGLLFYLYHFCSI